MAYRQKKQRKKEYDASGKNVGNGIIVRIYHDSMHGYFSLHRKFMTVTDRFHVNLPRPMSHEEIYARILIAFGILPNQITSKVDVKEIFELGVEEYERRKGN